MTDYLGRMAARSLDRLTSLRPRLRSRFESAGTATGWGDQEVELEVEGPPPAPRASEGPVRSARARPTAGHPAASALRPAADGGAVEHGTTRSDPAPAEERTTQMAATVEPEAAVVRPARRPLPPGAATPPRPRSPADQGPRSRTEEPPPGDIGERRSGAVVAAWPPNHPRPGPGPDRLEQGIEVRPGDVPELFVRRPGPDPDRLEQGIEARPGDASRLFVRRPGPSLVAPPAPRPAAPPGPAPERDERPTVRVSIGRIEVQALAGPAPAPSAPRRTSTIQSLDAYLEQRRRARR